MSKRAARRAKRTLNARVKDYKVLKYKTGFNEPGSQNPRQQGRRPPRKRR